MEKHRTTKDQEVLDLLMELPFQDPIIEDEIHILRICPLYEDLRQAYHKLAASSIRTLVKSLDMPGQLET